MLNSLQSLDHPNGTVHNPFTYTIKISNSTQSTKLSKVLGLKDAQLPTPSRFDFHTQWWSDDPAAAEHAALLELRREKVARTSATSRPRSKKISSFGDAGGTGQGLNDTDDGEKQNAVNPEYRWHCIVEYSASPEKLPIVQASKKNRPHAIPCLVVIRRHRDSSITASREPKAESGCFELNNNIWRFEYSAPQQPCNESNMNEAYNKSYLIGHICAIAYHDTLNSSTIGSPIWDIIVKAYNNKISREQGLNAPLLNTKYHPWNWGHVLKQTISLPEWHSLWRNALRKGTSFSDARTLTRTIFARIDNSHSKLFTQWAKCAVRGVEFTKPEQNPRVRKIKPWDSDLCEHLFGRNPDEPLSLETVKRCPEQLRDSEYEVMKRLSCDPHHVNLYNMICQAAGVPLNMDTACLFWVGQRLVRESLSETMNDIAGIGASSEQPEPSSSHHNAEHHGSGGPIGVLDGCDQRGPLGNIHPYLRIMMLSCCLSDVDRSKLSKQYSDGDEDITAKEKAKSVIHQKLLRIRHAVDAMIVAAFGKNKPGFGATENDHHGLHETSTLLPDDHHRVPFSNSHHSTMHREHEELEYGEVRNRGAALSNVYSDHVLHNPLNHGRERSGSGIGAASTTSQTHNHFAAQNQVLQMSHQNDVSLGQNRRRSATALSETVTDSEVSSNHDEMSVTQLKRHRHSTL